MPAFEFFDFVVSARNARLGRRPPPEIRERWQTRVVANNWHRMGARGAEEYLLAYGRNIGVDKAVWLAVCAEQEIENDIDYKITAFGDPNGEVRPKLIKSNPFAITMWKAAHIKANGPPALITPLDDSYGPRSETYYEEVRRSIQASIQELEDGVSWGKKTGVIKTGPKPTSRFGMLEIEGDD